jgi:hypothetical protein
MKLNNLVFVGLTVIGSAFTHMPEAQANHCSRFDFTCSSKHRGSCNFSGGNCNGGPPPSHIPTQQNLPRTYSINYQNATSATIQKILVRRWDGSDSSWSGDLLGQNILKRGYSLPIRFDDSNGCYYDLYATLYDGSTRFINDFNACTVGTLYIR